MATQPLSLEADYDPIHQAQADDPYPTWEAALSEHPVFFSTRMQAWIVTSFTLVSQALEDNETFLNSGLDFTRPTLPEVQGIFAELPPVAAALRAVDGADHKRRRRISQHALAMRRVSQMDETIREIANDLIDRFEDDGEGDFYRAFAYRFPLTVVSRLLGFSPDDADQRHRWGNSRVALLWAELDLEQHKAVARDIVAFHNPSRKGSASASRRRAMT